MSTRAHWRPPTAICSLCGRKRPCDHARTDAPICQSCARGRIWGRGGCASCGRDGRLAGRTARGAECSRCRTRRLKARLDCPACGRPGRPSVADPAICEGCAREPVRQVCRRCGATEQNYAAGCCARCVLDERLDTRLDTLAATGDPGAIARLAPYLTALRDGEKPWSAIKWMTVSAG